MSDLVNGGPAFPIETTATPYAPGMSLRDWFAGQAIMGLIASGRLSKRVEGITVAQWFAKEAYIMADAMLEAREE